MFGYLKDEFVGTCFKDLHPKENQEASYNSFHSTTKMILAFTFGALY